MSARALADQPLQAELPFPDPPPYAGPAPLSGGLSISPGLPTSPESATPPGLPTPSELATFPGSPGLSISPGSPPLTGLPLSTGLPGPLPAPYTCLPAPTRAARIAELRAATARVLANARPISRRAARRVPLPVVPPPRDELRALEYAVVDVETTGGSAFHGHRITEVAAVRMAFDGTVLAEYATLVNPERSIPPFISALTNITAEMVREAPRFPDVAADLQRVLAGAVFVAHNAAFDWRFVSHELERATGVPPLAPVLCTVRLARRVIPELGARSLDALTYYFDLENQARHRAFGDARVTAAILARLLARLDDHEVASWSALQEFLRRRKPRKPRGRHASPASIDPAEILPQ